MFDRTKVLLQGLLFGSKAIPTWEESYTKVMEALEKSGISYLQFQEQAFSDGVNIYAPGIRVVVDKLTFSENATESQVLKLLGLPKFKPFKDATLFYEGQLDPFVFAINVADGRVAIAAECNSVIEHLHRNLPQLKRFEVPKKEVDMSIGAWDTTLLKEALEKTDRGVSVAPRATTGGLVR